MTNFRRSNTVRGRRYWLARTACAGWLVYALAGAGTSAQAADPQRGLLLYENHCRACHTSEVHIRDRRIGKSEGLVRATIQRWQRQLELSWSNEEADDVYEYLNRRFYRFGFEK